MKWLAGGLAVVLLAGASSAVAAEPAGLVISCGAIGAEVEQCRKGAAAWSRSSGIPVKVVAAPASSTARLALYQQFLGAHSPDIDVLSVDVIWPGILGPHLLDLQGGIDPASRAGHFKAFMDANWYEGRLVAMPWFIGAGMLYYRKDLLEKYGEPVPETWSELGRIAGRIQAAERAAGNAELWGYVFQGRAYEGLTCNALEWLVSFGGGKVVTDTGDVDVDNPRAAKALQTAASWIGTISPRGVLNYMEEESRGVFQTGNAVFMRNWPYAWALAQAKGSPVRGRIGMVPLPRGDDGPHAATLGGWSLGVSRYSRNPAAAVSLVKFLTGAQEQRRRALTGEFHPTIEALYEDPALIARYPFWKVLHRALLAAVARPSRATGGEYNRVSAELWEAVHRTLSGDGDAKSNLGILEHRLNRLRRRGRW